MRGPNWPCTKPLFTLTACQVSEGLQQLLKEMGLPESEAATYTTHCLRRGAGVDVLEAEALTCHALAGTRWHHHGAYGLPGMLRMGEWATTHSAAPYASSDEQASATIAYQILEGSDEEAWTERGVSLSH